MPGKSNSKHWCKPIKLFLLGPCTFFYHFKDQGKPRYSLHQPEGVSFLRQLLLKHPTLAIPRIQYTM